MNAPQTTALMLWQRMHWSFFIHVQGLILCLGRFEAAVAAGDLEAAGIELETASALMRASGAAMELTASFTREEYEQEVRVTMMAPHVGVTNFSGLMSWEHASLMQRWKQLKAVFERLPPALETRHADFVAAYEELATSHRAVCAKFGGGEGGSLRFDHDLAVDLLDKFAHNRRALINPKGHPKDAPKGSGGCPFSH